MNATAYFDTRHEAMSSVTATEGIRRLCYDRQAALVETLVRPGMTALDVGCGPSLPYRADRSYVIGLDPSAETIAANTDVDDRIVGTAEVIPLPDRSVDLVVAFYSLHHMTGRTSRETYLTRSRALWEMHRVLRPGGDLLVFEMVPHSWAATLQRLLWPVAKRLLGSRLDAYFWTSDQIRSALPYPVREHGFDCPPFVWFPPVLSLPWLLVPRFLYPFDAVLLRWRKES